MIGAAGSVNAPAAGRIQTAVSVVGLTRSHGGGGRGRRGTAPVLSNDDITLSVGLGEIFGVLGPNGAGKTTLIRQLAGVLRPDSGEISLLGHNITSGPSVAPRLLAHLAQEEPAMRELTVRHAVETTGRLRGMPRSEAVSACTSLLAELGLEDLGARALSTLSGGQRRLAELATALVGARPLLLLDEPTTGLDPVARRAAWEALARRTEQGATVILVTHNVLEAETVLDRVAVLERGRVIACDTPGRLKALVSDDVRLDLVWRADPPLGDPTVDRLAVGAVISGRRWSCRLPQNEAREALGRLTSGPAFEALDDFTLATPSLEDAYLRLGGVDSDLERG